MKRRNATDAATSAGQDQLTLFEDAPNPLLPADNALRERFIHGVEENFSIIAPAGVGKTQSIVERIVAIAQHKKAAEWLPRLVVVTFTKRAADEMQQRTREEILRAQVSLHVLEQFNRAFFGTIHSFCVELLRNFGHHVGLPAKFELVEKDDQLWWDFLQENVALRGLKDDHQQRFSRHAPLQKVLRLGRTLTPVATDGAALRDCKDIDFDELLAHPPCGQSQGNVEGGQELVREWRELFCRQEQFLPLPKYKKGGHKFQELWRRTFAPFREWLCSCALCVASETARQYRAFRVARGMLTYDDQVALASELLRLPSAARQIREREYRVILDEAQDTDVAQFHVLLECTRPVDADDDWQNSRVNPPAPGRFSMVGDSQQSIYSGRADLARYASIRGLLGRAPAGNELAFTTTFRCDEAIIQFVNETFLQVFNDPRQVSFVPLRARPEAGGGQVARFEFDLPDELDAQMTDRKRAIIEADALAEWIVENGREKLRASSWSEVAILVPQKRWFSPLRIALRNAGIRTQVQSPRDIRGDRPAYAWISALIMVAANPRNHFEIFGLLRELFGISDDELAHFSSGNGHVFRIDRESEEKGAVASALNLLARTRHEIQGKPLRDAVAHLISATKLRARLAALPREFFDNTAPELDDLLALASSAEADGQTLCDFAETLRQIFYTIRETRPAEMDAIQLLTCHKAKGLQWDAVILPFFHRRQYPARSHFPRLIHRGSELPAIVALEGDDILPETKELVDTRERQEMERLLYVSLTRARHTLVLADDAELFRRAGNVHRHSLAGALKLFEFEPDRKSWRSFPAPNHGVWKSLCTQLSVDEAAVKVGEIKISESREEIPSITPQEILRAKQHGSEFPRRTLPSSFAGHRSDERWRLDREPEWRQPAPGSAAIAYGTWWHQFMQSLPWRDAEARARAFSEASQNAPDKTRSTREWELFNASSLAPQIFGSDVLVHSEMPLLWRKNENECVEGVIDLAIFAPDSGEWLVVDWKTDLIVTEDAESLREAYGPQIAAYVEAIAAITQRPARGGVYSTSIGAWLPV